MYTRKTYLRLTIRFELSRWKVNPEPWSELRDRYKNLSSWVYSSRVSRPGLVEQSSVMTWRDNPAPGGIGLLRRVLRFTISSLREIDWTWMKRLLRSILRSWDLTRISFSSLTLDSEKVELILISRLLSSSSIHILFSTNLHVRKVKPML